MNSGGKCAGRGLGESGQSVKACKVSPRPTRCHEAVGPGGLAICLQLGASTQCSTVKAAKATASLRILLHPKL